MSNPNPFGTQILSWFATSSSSILKSTSSNVISILNIEVIMYYFKILNWIIVNLKQQNTRQSTQIMQ